jgi:hypothetical protein
LLDLKAYKRHVHVSVCRHPSRQISWGLQGGLATVHRDRTYLDMDEEQKAKRLLVISKTEVWIKTEAQAMIDRAKVQPPCPAGV